MMYYNEVKKLDMPVEMATKSFKAMAMSPLHRQVLNISGTAAPELPQLHAAIHTLRYVDIGNLLGAVESEAVKIRVNEAGPFNWTPLHIASMAYAQAAHANRPHEILMVLDMICEELLERGANINAKDMFGLTPLASAEGTAPPCLRKAVAKYWTDHPAPETFRGDALSSGFDENNSVDEDYIPSSTKRDCKVIYVQRAHARPGRKKYS